MGHRVYNLPIHARLCAPSVPGHVDVGNGTVVQRVALETGSHDVCSDPIRGERSIARLGGTMAYVETGCFALDGQTLSYTAGVTEGLSMFEWPTAAWSVELRGGLLHGRARDALVVVQHATATGIASEIIAVDCDGKRTRLDAMDGQIGFIASSDELIVSIVKLADESTHADVLHRPSGVRRRFGDVMGRCPCVDGVLAAIDLQSGVLVVRGGSRPTATRVPLGGCPGDIRIEGESLFAVVGTHLFAIDLGALTWSTNDAAQDIRARYIRPRGASSAELAEVIFAGRLMVLAHPTWGRLTVSLKPGDPPVTKGARVSLDEVHEKLPGLFEVRRWHLHGEAQLAAESASDEFALDASSVAARTHAPPPVKSALDLLRNALGAAGAALQPSLERVARRWDSDPVVRQLFRSISILFDQPPPATAEVVPLAGCGSGDALYFLVVPQALAHSGSDGPPIVRWVHELETYEWVAPGINAWIHLVLDQHEALRTALASEFETGSEPRPRAYPTPPWFAGLGIAPAPY